MISKLFGNKDSKSFYVEDRSTSISRKGALSISQKSFTEKYHSALATDGNLRLTYDSASPENIDLVIKAAYKQVFDNTNLMESERLPQLESQLRSGRINVKEFISSLAKSEQYRALFLEKYSNLKTVELNFKHFLGRAPKNRQEISEHIQILVEEGLEAEIDSYLDSAEYQENFGNAIVPFVRNDKYPQASKKIASTKIDSLPVFKAARNAKSQAIARNAVRSASFSRSTSTPVATTAPSYSYTKSVTSQPVSVSQPVAEVKDPYADSHVSEEMIKMARSMRSSTFASTNNRRAVNVNKKFLDMARNLPSYMR